MQASVIAFYDANATRLADTYELVPPMAGHPWLTSVLPATPGVVIDIGAGSGRDAAAYATAGHEVLAVDPSSGMRTEGLRRHPSLGIRWIDDSLPTLSITSRAGILADVVSVSAVWQHVASADRPRAFRKMTVLLRSGGLLVMTLRHGPDDGRGGHPVSLAEIEGLARDHGLQVIRVAPSPDIQDRPGISWTGVVLRLSEPN